MICPLHRIITNKKKAPQGVVRDSFFSSSKTRFFSQRSTRPFKIVFAHSYHSPFFSGCTPHDVSSSVGNTVTTRARNKRTADYGHIFSALQQVSGNQHYQSTWWSTIGMWQKERYYINVQTFLVTIITVIVVVAATTAVAARATSGTWLIERNSQVPK